MLYIIKIFINAAVDQAANAEKKNGGRNKNSEKLVHGLCVD
jgi:hypothetical protein